MELCLILVSQYLRHGIQQQEVVVNSIRHGVDFIVAIGLVLQMVIMMRIACELILTLVTSTYLLHLEHTRIQFAVKRIFNYGKIFNKNIIICLLFCVKNIIKSPLFAHTVSTMWNRGWFNL